MGGVLLVAVDVDTVVAGDAILRGGSRLQTSPWRTQFLHGLCSSHYTHGLV